MHSAAQGCAVHHATFENALLSRPVRGRPSEKPPGRRKRIIQKLKTKDCPGLWKRPIWRGFSFLTQGGPSRASTQNRKHFVVNFSVGAHELPGINRSLAARVCGAAAGFLDHDAEWREVPRFRSPIQRHFDRTLRDKHVLPESAERTAVARRV